MKTILSLRTPQVKQGLLIFSWGDLAVHAGEAPKQFFTKLKGRKLGQESPTPAAGKQGFCFLKLGFGQKSPGPIHWPSKGLNISLPLTNDTRSQISPLTNDTPT